MFRSYEVNVTSNMIIEPPTEKQISYAKSIAEALQISLPEESTKRAYREFISESQADYEEFLFFLGLRDIGMND